MVLVDTTVWDRLARGTAGAASGRLARLLHDGDAAIAPVILRELLQGAASPAALRTLQRQFLGLPMLEASARAATHAAAGELYARCR